MIQRFASAKVWRRGSGAARPTGSAVTRCPTGGTGVHVGHGAGFAGSRPRSPRPEPDARALEPARRFRRRLHGAAVSL
jgi:hypothetical protein